MNTAGRTCRALFGSLRNHDEPGRLVGDLRRLPELYRHRRVAGRPVEQCGHRLIQNHLIVQVFSFQSYCILYTESPINFRFGRLRKQVFQQREKPVK